MVEPVVKIGVTPLETLILGVTVPEYNNLPAPDVAVPTAKWVTVSVPPVAAGNTMSAAGETELAVTVHPAPDLATETLA